MVAVLDEKNLRSTTLSFLLEFTRGRFGRDEDGVLNWKLYLAPEANIVLRSGEEVQQLDVETLTLNGDHVITSTKNWVIDGTRIIVKVNIGGISGNIELKFNMQVLISEVVFEDVFSPLFS